MKFISFLTATALLVLGSFANNIKSFWSGIELKPQFEFSSVDKSNGVDISYKLTTVTKVEPLKGTLQDLTPGDIRMLIQDPEKFEVENNISNAGLPCITVTKLAYSPIALKEGKSAEKESKQNDGQQEIESVSTYCNGQVTYSKDGRVRHLKVENDRSFWLEYIKSFTMTEKELANNFQLMIKSFQQSGAYVSEKENTIKIVEQIGGGKQAVSVYNKNNYELLFNSLIDASGAEKTFHYSYTCTSDGHSVPKSIRIESLGNAPISKKTVKKTKWINFEDYTISL